MSNHRDHTMKQRTNDHLLKSLPTEVLLKARSTLVSLGGALKSRHDRQQQQPKSIKQESKDKKNNEKLKTSISEPEFSKMRKQKLKSVTDNVPREYVSVRPRPLSVGAAKRFDKENDDIFPINCIKESSINQRQFDSSEDVCVHSRLVIPVNERLSNQDVQVQEVSERPRKKLSFREPEIVGSGSATLGRSHKLMGVNSLTRKPNRLSLRSDTHYTSLDGLECDLESQAMRIVRTVGQAFEVCHKMQTNSPDQPAPSTSSAADELTPIDRVSDVFASKEAASECGGSESGATSKSKVVEEGAVGGDQARPHHLELLPPPPRKDSKRSPQHLTPAPSITLSDLPECVTKVEITAIEEDANTPLSAQHQLQLLRERLEQQAQHTRAAVAQLLLLRDQLAAEQSARCEAQARTHQLLIHNKELLEHIAALVTHLQERERGSSRPINAQQLTLLPQMKEQGVCNEPKETYASCNGNVHLNADPLTNLFTQCNLTQTVENNNIRMPPFNVSPNLPGTPRASSNGSASMPSFGGMTNEQIQNYLISKFHNMGGYPNSAEFNANMNMTQQFYQNSNAFPNIPPLTNHCSNTDLANLLNNHAYKEGCGSSEEFGTFTQPMSLGHSENSLCSNSQATTSKDSTPDAFSSDDGIPFIMPLSHNGTLTATGEDGRVRLIVPVSPSGSSSDVPEIQTMPQMASGATLKVPGAERVQTPAGPITRTTSEKVPNRSEMMTALRAQWTRHTTK